MSWFPSYRPQNYFDVMKILCDAVNERLQSFPFSRNGAVPILDVPDRACSIYAAKDAVS